MLRIYGYLVVQQLEFEVQDLVQECQGFLEFLEQLAMMNRDPYEASLMA